MRDETAETVERLREMVRIGETALARRPILEPREVAMLIARTEMDRMRLEIALREREEDSHAD